MAVEMAVAKDKPCPVCGKLVEPEMDGDLRYYECLDDDCEAGGYLFGYERIQTDDSADCQIGVPESVRRAGPPPEKSSVVPLGLSIGKRPGL